MVASVEEGLSKKLVEPQDKYPVSGALRQIEC